MTDPEQTVSARQAEALVRLGKSCSNYAYPNPERVGCPDDATLRAMAFRNPAMPVSTLPISHVVSCTPCYLKYCQHRKQALWRSRFEYAAVSVAVVAVLMVALWMVRDFWSPNAEPRLSVNAPSKLPTQEPPALSPKGEGSTEGQSDPSRKVTVLAPLPTKAELDLRNQSIPRSDDAGRKTGPHQTLPRAFLDLTVQLPFASPPGMYEAGIFQLDQRPLVTAPARAEVRNGATLLRMQIDLSDLRTGERLFGFRRDVGDWAYTEVTIR